MGRIRRSRALCASTGLPALVAAQVQVRFSATSPHSFPYCSSHLFPLLPGTFSNFHCYHFYFPTRPPCLSFSSYLQYFLVLFQLFAQLLSLSLLLLIFSYVLCDFNFSQTFALFYFSCYFCESLEKAVLGDPGTPGNVKVIAGDCQRLMEVVDNSTLKNLNSH